jgi:hypothetical protein
MKIEENWMKLVVGTSLEDTLNAWQRRLQFKVSGFKFQACSILKKKLQCININFCEAQGMCVYQGLFPESA